MQIEHRTAGALMRADRKELEALADPELARKELRTLMKSVRYPEGWFYMERASVMMFWLTGQIAPDMDGMQVTVFGNLFGPAGETQTWTASGVDAGGAIGTGWTLDESGDTFVDLWQFDVTEPDLLVDRILISGVSAQANDSEGAVVFDRTEPLLGTGGSYRGRDFEFGPTLFTGNTGINVTYADLIDNQADGLGSVGDLFGQLGIEFYLPQTGGDLGGRFGANDRLQFYLDTDLVGVRVPCDPSSMECPEPQGAVLVLLSLAAGLPFRRCFG